MLKGKICFINITEVKSDNVGGSVLLNLLKMKIKKYLHQEDPAGLHLGLYIALLE